MTAPAPRKYRKRPVVIEAYQTDRELVIPTLEGDHKASPGDYIITGVKGEVYPCKPDIFAMTYEVVEDSPAPAPCLHANLAKVGRHLNCSCPCAVCDEQRRSYVRTAPAPAPAEKCPADCPCGGTGKLAVLPKGGDKSNGTSTLIRPVNDRRPATSWTPCPWGEVAALKEGIAAWRSERDGMQRLVVHFKARAEKAEALLAEAADLLPTNDLADEERYELSERIRAALASKPAKKEGA